MREIKFRAWDKENKWMDAGPLWINTYGDVYDVPSRQYDTPNVEIEPCGSKYTIMQYTGLHDKNGKEIYEGDIVQDESIYRAPFWQYKISWNDSKAGWLAFPLDDANYGLGLSVEGAKTLEVIGNIYEGVINETENTP